MYTGDVCEGFVLIPLFSLVPSSPSPRLCCLPFSLPPSPLFYNRAPQSLMLAISNDNDN